MHRRELLAALTASTSIAIAGCLGGEDGSYEFDAEPARISPTALDDAGYEGEAPEAFTVDEEFDVAGVNAQISATTWVARYQNPIEESALFVASTPDASVAGQSVNPLVRAGDAELIRQLLEQIEQQGVGGEDAEIEADDIEERGSETRMILDQEVEISILETTVDADVGAEGAEDGEVEDIPVLLYVGTVQHEDDVITLVGVHPVGVDAAEELLSLMEHVEHPVTRL